MISGDSAPRPENRRLLKNGAHQVSPNERVGRALMKLHNLLELNAPAWYTKELQEEAEAALLALR